MAITQFFVPGNPKALKRHKTYTRGRDGKPLPFSRQVDPNVDEKMNFLAKAMEYRPEEPLRGPLCVRLICVFGRPASHYGTGRNAGHLKDSSPAWYVGNKDLDNIEKFVGDALNGIFWYDDRLIVHWPSSKIYGSVPGIALRLWRPTPVDHAVLCSLLQQIKDNPKHTL